MSKKPWSTLIIVIYFLAACSSTHIKIIETPNFRMQELASFKIESLRTGPTHSSTVTIAGQAGTIEKYLTEKMQAKGYQLALKEKPAFIVSLQLAALTDSILMNENANFMKGARGSNFPSADPRKEIYNSDVLELQVSQKSEGPPNLIAVCRLNDGQDHGSTVGVKDLAPNEIHISEVENCLKVLLEELPNYKF